MIVSLISSFCRNVTTRETFAQKDAKHNSTLCLSNPFRGKFIVSKKAYRFLFLFFKKKFTTKNKVYPSQL